MAARQEKITFAEMRAAGVRGVLVYCSDYRCSHSLALIAIDVAAIAIIVLSAAVLAFVGFSIWAEP
jgi:hypothetical protein